MECTKPTQWIARKFGKHVFKQKDGKEKLPP
jgi:hypothetical protein